MKVSSAFAQCVIGCCLVFLFASLSLSGNNSGAILTIGCPDKIGSTSN